MDSRQLYDEDILAWSEHQAAMLRRLAGAAHGLPSDLDLDHVAEEIEDGGRSRLDAAESFTRLMLTHPITLAAAPGSSSARHWRSEIVTFQIQLQSKLTASMHHRIDLERLWLQAKRQAGANLDESREANRQAPVWAVAACPLELPMIVSDDLDVSTAVALLDRPA